MAAATGASLRELMDRMGHSSSRAALIYQHASRDRDEAIAAALGESLTAASGRLSVCHRARNGHAEVHLRVIRRRCQRRTVPGVTSEPIDPQRGLAVARADAPVTWRALRRYSRPFSVPSSRA